MSKVLNYNGGDELYHRGSIFTGREEPSLFLSLGSHMDVYFPLFKKSRVSAPFSFNGDRFEQTRRATIEVLPDECLFEIFRRLSDDQVKSSCACVSKRWLMLLSDIRRDDLCNTETLLSPEPATTLTLGRKDASTGGQNKVEKLSSVDQFEDGENESVGYLSRCLEGKKATDVRLTAIAVGTASRGGLGKLSIRGSNSSKGITDIGLRAIARRCPSLKVLSLWNVSAIGDEGLIEIANNCPSLERLDLCHCPSITDKSLAMIVKNSPNLATITIESCANIGNVTLQAIGQFCSNLSSISIKSCPLINDQGIVSLFSSASCALKKVKIQALNLTDISLAIIGHYGKAVTDLFLIGLQNVSEKGFWVMGNGQGLQLLKSLTIVSCQGVSDIGLEALGKGCPSLKQFCLRKCAVLSDAGLVKFSKAARSLENLRLEECHGITQFGLFASLVQSGPNLMALSLVKCLGIKNQNLGPQTCISPCQSLQSLSIRDCPGFGNASIPLLGELCPHLQTLDFSGLSGITDDGILHLIQTINAGLVKVNLNNCVNITDEAVCTLADLHGFTLEVLNVGGCGMVTDASLKAVAENCFLLQELDVSKSAVTDCGIAALARGKQVNLQILSVSGCALLSEKSLPYLMELGSTLMGLNLQHCGRLNARKAGLLTESLWGCDVLA